MAIILASQSPRRRELLAQMGLTDFIIRPAQGEEILDPSLTPDRLVEELSRQKAAEVAATAGPEDVIIAADTVVAVGNRVLGKPHSQREAEEMLTALSGRTHTVYTGITVCRGDCSVTQHEATPVHFRTLTPEEIQWEIDSTNDLIFAATGTTANLLRPPYGEFDENVLSAGYPVVTWCIDTLDWMHMDPQKSLQAVQENAFDGCIILMHDMFETSAQGCRLIVPWLIGEGYELVTVSELFAAKGQTLSSGSTHRWAG